MIDPINAPHFDSTRRAAFAASQAAQAEAKRRNDEATRAADPGGTGGRSADGPTYWIADATY